MIVLISIIKVLDGDNYKYSTCKTYGNINSNICAMEVVIELITVILILL